jgi:hypothetical protein
VAPHVVLRTLCSLLTTSPPLSAALNKQHAPLVGGKHNLLALPAQSSIQLPWLLWGLMQTWDAFPKHVMKIDAGKYFIMQYVGGELAPLSCPMALPCY